MERQKILEHLRMTEDHVARGHDSLVRQREAVATLEQRGRDASTTKKLLATFQTLQAASIVHRNRLRQILNE